MKGLMRGIAMVAILGGLVWLTMFWLRSSQTTSQGWQTHETATISLNPGETLQVWVDDQRADVRLKLQDDDFAFTVDHPLGTAAAETLWFRSPVQRALTLEVQLWAAAVETQPYALTINRFAASDRQAAKTAAAFLLWCDLQGLFAQGKPDKALDAAFRQLGLPAETDDKVLIIRAAIDACLAADQPLLAARMWMDLANYHFHFGPHQAARPAYREALTLFQALDAHAWAERSARDVAYKERQAGYLTESMAAAELALHLAESAARTKWIGLALNEKGQTLTQLGKLEAAIGCLQEALAQYQRIDADRAMAITRLNLGIAMRNAGLWSEAEAEFLTAATFWQAEHHGKNQADALLELGWIDYLRGDFGAAIVHYQDALAIKQSAGLNLGGILDRWGSALREQGAFQAAETKYRQALEQFPGKDQMADRAHVQVNLAELFLKQQQLASAREWLAPGLAYFQEQQHVLSAAQTLRLRGHIAMAAKDWLQADQDLQTALALLDQVRHDTANVLLARAFNDMYHQIALDGVAVDMRRHALDEKAGFDEKALLRLESQRAMVLRTQLALRAAESNVVTSNEASAEPMAATELDSASTEAVSFESIYAYYAARAEAGKVLHELRPASLVELQAGLHDHQAALVFVTLPGRSYLWELTAKAMTSHTLSGQRDMETMVQPLIPLLAKPSLPFDRAQRQQLLALASEQLLGALTLARDKPEWIMVADGFLHRLPWSALPDPVYRDDPLVAHRAISFLPSLTTGQALRSLSAGNGGGFVGLGGAVYEPQQEPNTNMALHESIPNTLRQDFSRNLPHSRGEVTAIADLWPAQPKTLLLDEAANLNQWSMLDLEAYNLLHFAVHGYHHPSYGDLSALVLSTFDAAGQPRPAFLRAIDIQSWRIRAELVTLSACQTALGESLQGEGVWGLSQAMMIAGAKRVVTSLWSVRDDTTKTLMINFYQNMLRKNMSPAEALRTAQATMASDPTTRDPYFWAGFVLQGISDPLPLGFH